MIEEVDPDEFERLKADKLHQDLLSALKGLSSLVKQLEPLLRLDEAQGRALLSSIQKTTATVDALSSKVQALTLAAPKVHVDISGVTAAIEKMSEILKTISAQGKPPTYEFEVNRGTYGNILSVIAKPKQ